VASPFEVVARRLPQQLFDAVPQKPGLADPVGADEAAAGTSCWRSVGRSRRPRRAPRPLGAGVGQDLQGGVDVLADAGVQQPATRRAAARDGLFDDVLDVAGH